MLTPRRLLLPALTLGLLLSLTACSRSDARSEADAAPSAEAAASLPVVTVYKSPTCGCCKDWVKHMEEEGFTVETVDMPNVASVKDSLSVPQQLRSCHTATVDGYALEGHVPAADAKRMLRERPDISGIAVPGMPVGSPGMEVEGRPAQRYNVLAFDQGSFQSIYAER